MEIYSLTTKGRLLAQNIKSQPTTRWRIIYFLAKHGNATKEQVVSYCGGNATEATLALNYLTSKGLVSKGMGVVV